MPKCNYCHEIHAIFADWAACNSRQKMEELDADLYGGMYEYDDLAARYDDDPSPYSGTYSEE